MNRTYALLGWSLPVIQSIQQLDVNYVVVSFADFEDYSQQHDIPFVSWDFREWTGQHGAKDLADKLQSHNVDVAVPLYEETVEWAGALNSLYWDDPKVFNRAFLYRNKAMMKRKAHLEGLKVGLFDEVNSREEVKEFYDKLNEAQLHQSDEEEFWVHMKPFAAAGTVGHRLIRTKEDIDVKVSDDDFPCMVESHLPGKEFSTEAFVHNGKIQFLNITEYVRLGYTNFVPPGPDLEEKRPLIKESCQKLVDAFGMQNGFNHAEWFLDGNDEIRFGEVAARIPGGHILELVGEAYEFDTNQAYVLTHDPKLSDKELAEYIPAPDFQPSDYAGCLMVYPEPGSTITKLEIPEELKNHDYFQSHTLFEPQDKMTISEREGFGNHFGTIFLKGPSAEEIKNLLQKYDKVAFYG